MLFRRRTVMLRGSFLRVTNSYVTNLDLIGVLAMRLAKVVGNVVSTVKDEGYAGQKLMIVEYINRDGTPDGVRQIAFDCANAGMGDMVLVNVDGGAANMLLGSHCIADLTICGVVDSVTFCE